MRRLLPRDTVLWSFGGSLFIVAALIGCIGAGVQGTKMVKNQAAQLSQNEVSYFHMTFGPSMKIAEQAGDSTIEVTDQTAHIAFNAKDLHFIIYFLLEVSNMRFQWDVPVSHQLYDLDVAWAIPAGAESPRRRVVDIIGAIAGVKVEEVVREEEVWVARRTADSKHPSRDAEISGNDYDARGYRYGVTKIAGDYYFTGLSSRRLLDLLEGEYGTPFEDEVGISDGCAWCFGSGNQDFESLRAVLKDHYGVTFTSERRSVMLYRVHAVGSSEPHTD